MPPAVSVLMPVWNGETYLAAAVESILQQTFQDFELLVLDDGSTDRTPEILRSYSDPRMQVHRLDHGGLVAALNTGIALSKATWIVRQDADDISLPSRLEVQWRSLQGQPDAVLCFTGIELFGAPADRMRTFRIPQSTALTALRLCFQCPIAHSTVMFKKEPFLASGAYRADERHVEDYAAWGRLLEFGPFVGIAEPLLRLRLHEQSVSQKNLDEQIGRSKEVAIRHCKRFFRVDDEAERAFQSLIHRGEPAHLQDWWWFVSRIAPRLRWQSVEMWQWLTWQSLKLAVASLRGWLGMDERAILTGHPPRP